MVGRWEEAKCPIMGYYQAKSHLVPPRNCVWVVAVFDLARYKPGASEPLAIVLVILGFWPLEALGVLEGKGDPQDSQVSFSPQVGLGCSHPCPSVGTEPRQSLRGPWDSCSPMWLPCDSVGSGAVLKIFVCSIGGMSRNAFWRVWMEVSKCLAGQLSVGAVLYLASCSEMPG